MGSQPSTRTAILTVCTANICRSPVMQFLLQERLGAAVEVSSAGVQALIDSPIDPRSMETLAAQGLSTAPGSPAATFSARPLTARHAAAADLVLTATAAHRDHVLRLAPHALKRTFTLLEFAHALRRSADAPTPGTGLTERIALAARHRAQVEPPIDVPDPVGLDVARYAEIMDLIDRTVGDIATALAPRPGAPAVTAEAPR